MVDIDEYSPAHLDASSISPETWRRFENATLAVVHRIQPAASSEYLRASVIDYLQRLVMFHTGCQVFSVGSVPLKTYIPDGDIDLTVSGSVSFHENFAHERYDILLSEEQSADSEFEVKDVQLINAERDFHCNGFMIPQDIKLELGILGALPLDVTSTERASRSDSASNNQVSGHVGPISTGKKAGMGCNRARNPRQYHLKDSGEFPPQSS